MNTEQKKKRLNEGGVGPAMRSPTGLALPQRETPLPGRRAGDAIAGGVRADILHADWAFVKRSLRQSWEA
jgi:hypothetical protein